MRATRPLATGLALCATLGALAAPAMAMRLTIDRAGDRALDFAERTCTRDQHCVRSPGSSTAGARAGTSPSADLQ